MIRINEVKSGSDVDKVLAEIYAIFGMIPKLWSLYANSPALLQANWTKQKLVMNTGVLRSELKEAIALSVSLANSCQYCVDAHKMMLGALGVDATLVESSSYTEAGFSDKEKILLEFAKEMNINAYKIPDEIFDALKNTHCNNFEILEVMGVVELYVGYNMFLNALNVPGGSL